MLIALLPLAFGILSLAAQGDGGQTTKVPVFEVASVRQNTSGDTVSSARWFPRRFTAVNYRLDMLVLNAFGIHIGRGPILLDGFRFDAKCLRNCSSREEILSAHFDVQATFQGEIPPTQQPLVLRAFLEDRFKVKARFETRDRPAYVLTLAREGQLGPRLRPSSHDCGVYAKTATEARLRGGAIPAGPVDAAGNPWCGNSNRSIDWVRTRKSAGPFEMLVNSLRGELPFQLIDRTGLTGNFEWELTSMSMESADRVPRQKAPTLDVALLEQLGLRLERSTAPLEVLVIDSAAMPSPN